MIGELRRCRTKDLLGARNEFLIILFITLLPVIGGLLIGFLLGDTTWLLKQFESGILAIYASAIIAPVFYIIYTVRNFDHSRSFPNFTSIIISSLGIVFFAGLFFVVANLEDFFGIQVDVNTGAMLAITGSLLFLSMIVAYSALAYRNLFDTGAADMMKQEEDEFVKNARGRHEG